MCRDDWFIIQRVSKRYEFATYKEYLYGERELLGSIR